MAELASGGVPLFGADEEMARVMAAHGWAGSPVGPPAEWPPLLQTMTRLILTSRFSMWMGWGPEVTFFYNQAYARDTLGVKHPWALGRPASEVWSEIWGDIGPRIRSVMTEGRATWDEALLLFLERSGYREETYHTFSYSPISDSDGSIVGLLCVVTEETQRVISERRMATLRDLASELSAARTEPAVFEAVAGQLDRNLKDLPFTLTYMFGPDGTAHLASGSGISLGHPAAPATLELSDAGAVWPLDQVLAEGGSVLLDGLGRRQVPVPAGAWPDPPSQAIMVPLEEGGQATPAGVFIAGLNPYRAFDHSYQGFAELVASSIASGVSGVRAYEAERRRAEALAELDRAKTEFFSNVSHEFRTPLTLITAPVDDALNDDLSPLPDAQRARMEVVQRNARRLRRLVNDMLDFARIEGGRLQAETVPTDLVQFTRDVALSFAPVIERSGLEFDLDLGAVSRPVHVDRDMWEKIVLNLLSNAVKFTLEGSIRVALQEDQTGDGAVLSVTDTGVGIAAEHQSRLFERFSRAPRSAARSYEGTGIGLALVAELARLHGGTVAVSSQEDVGSTFTVWIPFGSYSGSTPAPQRESSLSAYLDEALQWVVAETGSPAERQSVAGETLQSTVLIVDDNPDMRSYLARLLAPYWNVRVAADGAEALDVVRTDAPDLVLSDVMMPNLDGFGLLNAMRADPATATIPVVFLSARAGEEAAVEGLGAGADDYLVKPFSGLELLARVRSNLELAALRNRDAAWRSALVDSLQDAVVVLDRKGQVIEANEAFEQIVGYPRASVPYAAPFPWVYDERADPDAAADAEEVHRRVMAGERLAAVVPLRHRLGHRIHVAVSASPVGQGETDRTVVAFHDVTAELAAAERDAALAQLGVGLAEASDVQQVHEAGLRELRKVFRARRVSILSSEGDSVAVQAADGAGQPLPEPLAREMMAGVIGDGSVVVPVDRSNGDGPARGIGARLDPLQDGRMVWLEFDEPRLVPPEERSLFTALCGYFGQAVVRAQLFDEQRAVATVLQRSILGPTSVPPSIAVRYFPAIRPLEVGGDWYDVVELDGGRLGVVVGDCTGRGLQAAATMGQLRSACRALLLQAKGPAEVIAALDVFAERLPDAMCTTVFCGVIDDATSILHYSSAGHLPALLADRSGTVRLLDGGQGVPLGYLPSLERPEGEVQLELGATLVLYTDGLVERRGESLDVGIDRLRGELAERRAATPQHLADQLLGALVPEGAQDDIAVLVYRHPDPDGEDQMFHLAVRADAAELSRFRRRLRAWLSAVGLDERTVNDLLIASGEACANAIEHAYGFSADSTVDVSAAVTDDTVEVRIADRGRWKEPGSSENRGRGMAIMRALADDVRVERGPDGTLVRIVKEVER